MNAAKAAALAADMIARRGSTITFVNGVTVKGIADETYARARAVFGQDALDKTTGQMSLLYLSPASFALWPKGTHLTFHNQNWTMNVLQTQSFEDVIVQYILLCSIGINP